MSDCPYGSPPTRSACLCYYCYMFRLELCTFRQQPTDSCLAIHRAIMCAGDAAGSVNWVSVLMCYDASSLGIFPDVSGQWSGLTFKILQLRYLTAGVRLSVRSEILLETENFDTNSAVAFVGKKRQIRSLHIKPWSLYVPPALTLTNPHTVYLCVLCGSQNITAIISLYNITWLVFVTETQCVYCAVRAGSLYI